MHDLDPARLGQLAALAALARTGSFAAAGRRLGRDATVVSRRIKALEARLGIRLVERSTRAVRLTEAGAALAARLGDAFERIAAAEDAASAEAEAPRGLLRLALPGAMGRLWLAPMLPDFLSLHPAVTLEVDFSDRYVDLVAEGHDLALRIGALSDSRLVAKKLAPHRRILAAAPAWTARHGAPDSPDDIDPAEVLGFNGYVADREWRLTDGTRAAALRVEGRMRANDMDGLLEAARAGLGVVGAGEWMLARDIAAGRLARIAPAWRFAGEGAVHLVRPSRADPPARVSAFAAWIGARFAEGPPWERIDA